jgi:hypothetical protein
MRGIALWATALCMLALLPLLGRAGKGSEPEPAALQAREYRSGSLYWVVARTAACSLRRFSLSGRGQAFRRSPRAAGETRPLIDGGGTLPKKAVNGGPHGAERRVLIGSIRPLFNDMEPVMFHGQRF